MKKYTPLWMLYARSTLPCLLPLMALTAILETLLFSRFLSAPVVDAVFQNSQFHWAIALLFLLSAVILSCPSHRHAGHTLNRLPAGHLAQGLCHAGYNLLVLLLLWGFQLAVITGLALWFAAQAQPGAFGPQSLMLLFYRNRWLHALLPLHNFTGYFRLLAYFIALSAAAAYPNHHLGKQLTGSLTAVIVTLFLFYTLPSGRGQLMANLSWGTVALLLAVCLLFWQDVSGLTPSDFEPEEADRDEA